MRPPRPVLAQLEDGRMHYLLWPGPEGDAPPTLCFAHANGLNARTYVQLLGPLADRFCILAPDLRGHGATTLPAEPRPRHSLDVHVADLIAFLDRVAGPVLLAGHSLGALTALMATARRPDLVLGLVLAEPVVRPRMQVWLSQMRRMLNSSWHFYPFARMALRRRAAWPSRDAMLRTYRNRPAFRTWPEAVLRDYIEGGTRAHTDGTVELTCAPAWEAANFSSYVSNFWGHLRRVTAPLTLLYGTEWSSFVPAVRGRFRRAAPQSRIVPVGGTGHFLPMQAPEPVRAEIHALQDTLDAGR